MRLDELQRALGQLKHEQSDRAPVIVALTAALREDRHWEVRMQAAWSLGRLWPLDADAARALQLAADDDAHAHVREVAREALDKRRHEAD